MRQKKKIAIFSKGMKKILLSEIYLMEIIWNVDGKPIRKKIWDLETRKFNQDTTKRKKSPNGSCEPALWGATMPITVRRQRPLEGI